MLVGGAISYLLIRMRSRRNTRQGKQLVQQLMTGTVHPSTLMHDLIFRAGRAEGIDVPPDAHIDARLQQLVQHGAIHEKGRLHLSRQWADGRWLVVCEGHVDAMLATAAIVQREVQVVLFDVKAERTQRRLVIDATSYTNQEERITTQRVAEVMMQAMLAP